MHRPPLSLVLRTPIHTTKQGSYLCHVHWTHTRTHTRTRTHVHTHTHTHTHTHILHTPIANTHRSTYPRIAPHIHKHTYMHNFVCMPIAITARCLLCVCMCFSVLLVCFASGMMHKQTTLFTVNEARFPFTNSPYLFEGLI